GSLFAVDVRIVTRWRGMIDSPCPCHRLLYAASSFGSRFSVARNFTYLCWVLPFNQEQDPAHVHGCRQQTDACGRCVINLLIGQDAVGRHQAGQDVGSQEKETGPALTEVSLQARRGQRSEKVENVRGLLQGCAARPQSSGHGNGQYLL